MYLSQAIEHMKTKGKYHEELLPHISPLGWETKTFLENIRLILRIKHHLSHYGHYGHDKTLNFLLSVGNSGFYFPKSVLGYNMLEKEISTFAVLIVQALLEEVVDEMDVYETLFSECNVTGTIVSFCCGI